MATDPIERSVVSLLERIPETWAVFQFDALTEPESRALFLLVAAGMVERRGTIRLQLFGHSQVVEATIAATGEYGSVEAMERLAAGVWKEWREAFEQRLPEAPAFHCEKFGREDWRLTSDGIQGLADVRSGEPAALDFILCRNVLSDRPAVRGRGTLLRFERVSPTPSQSGVHIANWDEGAKLMAAVFAKMQAETKQEPGDEPGDPNFGGPEPDPHDDRLALWFGKRLYLGRDTETSRLFWLLAKPVGRACSRHDIEEALDGSWTTDFGTAEESRKAWQRIRKAVSKLKERLRDAEMDTHVQVVRGGSNADPEYSMIRRFPSENP